MNTDRTIYSCSTVAAAWQTGTWQDGNPRSRTPAVLAGSVLGNLLNYAMELPKGAIDSALHGLPEENGDCVFFFH
jgi:hypothetical protein